MVSSKITRSGRLLDPDDLVKPAAGSKFKAAADSDERWTFAPRPLLQSPSGLVSASETGSRCPGSSLASAGGVGVAGVGSIASVTPAAGGVPPFGTMSYQLLEIDEDLSTGAAFKEAFKEAYPDRHMYKFATNRLLSHSATRLEGFIAGSTAFTFLFQVRELENVSEEGGTGAFLRVWGRASQSDSWGLLLHHGASNGNELDVYVYHDTSTAVALSHQYATGAFYRFEVLPASTISDATFHAGVGFFGFFI